MQDGELIFSQGAPPRHLIFILAGEVVVKRHTSSAVSVLVGRTKRITGKTPFSRIRSWNADGRASGNVWLLELDDSQFPAMLTAIPSMTERMVRVLIDRNREYTRAEEQIGKLAALSKLAGNLAHELNNPASAARSAALALGQQSELVRNDARYQLGLAISDKAALDRYLKGLDAIRAKVGSTPHPSNSILAGDLEEALCDWLQNKGFEEAWKLAPILAEAEVSISELQDFTAPVAAELQPIALRDLLATVSQNAAIASIIQASERIFRIVAAVKDYSYMDRQPLQEVDIPAALDNVLMMFQPRLKDVIIKRNVTAELPLFQGYGSELNQAFSALIENGLDAMENRGTLTLSAKLQGETLLVEFEDDGRGIPKEYQDRVFEPFFTTKPLGAGLGLGLDTVQRVIAKHFGTVSFETSTQGTIFHVRLPVNRAEIY
ncbi:signal transduction histidine kinase [Silvibacterium bohemicum]|uniref:histidine kinase n=1 Tax=Silvibacterium bohemicum TaxID=1577686 RepID=A0A841JXM0_9BACT|nr:ATP-binding protein [Silvibacterium bohemicum]MBB6143188.1 signal transduction histidine kinase [Silvibacterium bohemicum]